MRTLLSPRNASLIPQKGLTTPDSGHPKKPNSDCRCRSGMRHLLGVAARAASRPSCVRSVPRDSYDIRIEDVQALR
jgi:hypothetical protein